MTIALLYAQVLLDISFHVLSHPRLRLEFWEDVIFIIIITINFPIGTGRWFRSIVNVCYEKVG